MSKYLITLIMAGSLPLALSFFPPLRFYHNIKRLIASIFLTFIIFGAWDVFAVWRGHWHFDPSGIIGLYVINLPVEEWLFFLVIPFCCIFTWESINYIRKRMR